MQYKPYNSALLAQETLFSAVKKALFLPEVFKKCVNRIKGIKKNRIFLGKSPKLWVGGGQES